MSASQENSPVLSYPYWQSMPPSAGELAQILGQNYVRVFAKKSNNPVMGTWFWDCDSVESLNEDGWDVYVVLNPTRHTFVGTKPSDTDMRTHRMTLVDYDVTVDNVSSESFYKASSTIKVISDACLTMFTGRGFQVWYKHSTDSTNFPEARLQSAAVLKRLVSHWQNFGSVDYRIDTCTIDISRLARWPNTINWKTGVRGIVYRINSAIVNRDVVQVPAPQVILPTNKGLTKLSEIAPRLNGTASKFLLEGVDHNVQSRHTAAYATARNLMEIGLSELRARELVLAGAAICTRAGEPFPLPAGDAAHAVKTAYKTK